MRLSQDNLLRNFPVADERAPEPARRPAQRSHRRDLVGHGRGRRIDRRLRRDRRQERRLPVHAARHLHGDRPRRPARRTSRTSAASGTTPATSRTCSPASRRSARAGCGFEHQFAAITRALGADGRGAAPAENQGFLRPDAYLAIVMITNEDDCSARRPACRCSTRRNTNLASQLGPPANFRCNEFGHLSATAAPEPQRARQRRERHGHLRRLHVERRGGYLALGRRHREPHQGAQGRRRSGHGRRDHRRAVALRRALEGAEHRRHVVRRRVVPLADDPALLHGRRRQLRRSRRAHQRARRPVRRQRPQLSICDDDFAPALSDIASEIVELRQRALHPGPDREAAGHDARRLHVVSRQRDRRRA